MRLFFVGTANPIINASRIARRVMTGGHDVPISKVISRFSKSIANCAYLGKFVDRLYVYDNSEDFEDPKLLFRSSNGKITKKYFETPEWASVIEDEIKP